VVAGCATGEEGYPTGHIDSGAINRKKPKKYPRFQKRYLPPILDTAALLQKWVDLQLLSIVKM